MNSRKAQKLLRKYLSGRITNDQKDIVGHWYHSFDSEKPLAIPDDRMEEIKEEVWNRMVPEISSHSSNHPIVKLSFLSKIAALLIVSVTIGFLVLKSTPENKPKPALFVTVNTKDGERKKVLLSDSSVLMLNGGTHIRISKDFSKIRKVEILDGEAYFDIHRDPSRPFLIRSGKITTKVLGTAFNISAYKELSKMSVAVLRGTVQVSSSKSTSILEKEQMLTFNKEKSTSNVGKAASRLFSWREGSLFLDDVSFADMAVLMEKNFGIRILMKQKSLGKTRYTAILPTSMAPVRAIEVIAAIHNLKIKKQGGAFLLFR